MNGPPVFLQTGFRTGGTWLWSRFRAAAHVAAFCEPLNEALQHVTEEQIAGLTAATSQLNHPALDTPYFQEYLPLLRSGSAGVPGYRAEFGLLSYFANADDQPDGLQEYIESLLHHAQALDKQPVLKFTRGLGRAGWFRRTFPQARQILLLRNPIEQFRSGLALARRTDNFTFLMIPPLVLSRCHSGPVAAQFDRLGLPRLAPGGDIGSCAQAYIGLSRTLPATVLFGAHLCMFIASIAEAHSQADLVIDQDLLAASDTYLHEMERRIEHLCGTAIDLSDYRSSQAGANSAERFLDDGTVADDVLDTMEESYPEAAGFTRRYVRLEQDGMGRSPQMRSVQTAG